MFDWVVLVGWLAQIEAQNPANNQGGGGEGGFNWTCLLMAMLPLMLMYFMMMSKPQSREQTKTKEMLANLRKNDRVITAGGIHGVVVNVNGDADTVTLRIDESTNTKVVLLKSSIARVIAEESDKDA